MLDLLFQIFNSIYNFFGYIFTFLSSGIYSFAVWGFSKFIESMVIGYLEFMLWAMPFAWSTAKQILIDLNLSSVVNAAWGQLDSNVLAYATVFRVPEALNLIVSGFFTKFVMRFIPFT